MIAIRQKKLPLIPLPMLTILESPPAPAYGGGLHVCGR